MDSSGMYPPPSTKSRGKDRKNKHKRNREEAPANIAPQEFAVTGRGSEPDPVYQEESHNNKTLLRAKDNGQFSSVWADEATCALVQQICVVLRDQFKGSRNTGAAWRTVADNLNQLGYKLGEHKDSRISSDECKSRWHHIGKEARVSLLGYVYHFVFFTCRCGLHPHDNRNIKDDLWKKVAMRENRK
eukprot:gb/GECG01013717.1/.p1 GENE.gb/GECG01013717.1/~~gb/GECG01013717.1/.p1  ORF type:complete len:187 (+),score=25.37 gb/GECG01013717.1/:1-561(+)